MGRNALTWEDHPTKLGFNEFVPAGRRLLRGQTSRLFHNTEDCSGESRSLVITRRENGYIVGYCHRCQRKGVYKKYAERILPKLKEGRLINDATLTVDTKLLPLTLPNDKTMAWSRWPVEAKMWLKKAFMTEMDSDINLITYSPKLRKVVIPFYEPTKAGKRLVGYQLRRVFKNDSSPKYITRTITKNYFKLWHKDENVCCLVEDYLSGCRVGKHVSSLCLFGISLHHTMIRALSKYKTIIIFLDNDNAIVKKKQMEMKKELENWFDNVITITSDKDPKEYDDHSLRNLFAGFTKKY